MISKVIYFVNTGIWKIRLKDLPALKAFFIRYLRVPMLALREFNKDECPKNASSLTYYSLLNIVPVAAVVFGIAKGFGLEKLIEHYILQLAQNADWEANVTHCMNDERGLILLFPDPMKRRKFSPV